jgi:hypothetical protein
MFEWLVKLTSGGGNSTARSCGSRLTGIFEISSSGKHLFISRAYKRNAAWTWDVMFGCALTMLLHVARFPEVGTQVRIAVI